MSSYNAFVERNTGQKVLVVICQRITPVIPQLQAPTGVREIQLERRRGWPHLLQTPQLQHAQIKLKDLGTAERCRADIQREVSNPLNKQ